MCIRKVGRSIPGFRKEIVERDSGGQQFGDRIVESLPRNPVSTGLAGNPISERSARQKIVQVTSREGTVHNSEETGFLSTDIRDAHTKGIVLKCLLDRRLICQCIGRC